MHYFIDGYNLLFHLSLETKTFEEARKQIIDALLNTKFSLTLVFDSKRADGPQRAHKGPLEIVYTTNKQSADAYIIEEISLVKNPKIYTVVTSDKNLGSMCSQIGAYVQTIDVFLALLQKNRTIPREEKPAKDSKKEHKRLLKIFTELDNTQ